MTVDAGTVSVVAITQQPAVKTVVAPGTDFDLGVLAQSSAPLAYQWYKDGVPLASGTAATLSVQNADLLAVGTYSVNVSSGSVVVQSSPALVRLSPVVTSPLSAFVLAGEALVYQITGSGSPTEFFASGLLPGFSFNQSTGVISGSSTVLGGTMATIGVRNADGEGTAQLALAVTGSGVTIPGPLVYNGPVVELGTDVAITVFAAGTPPFTYQWRKDGIPLASGTAATLQIPNALVATGGSYDVVVSNVGGTVTSTAVPLDLVGIVAQPTSQTVVVGGSASFFVGVTSTAPATVQWFKNGVPLDGRTSPMLSLPSVLSTDAGVYSAVVSLGAFTLDSSAATLTVNKAVPTVIAPPLASAIGYGQPLSASILSGGSASVGGSFAFSTPSAVLNAGTSTQVVKFTPADFANYLPTTTSVSVVVGPAAPTILAPPLASVITYGQTLASSTLSAGSASTAGNFVFATPSVAPNAGTAPQALVFLPNDAANYV
ncbi:MAG: hypothetical protein EBT09_12070, partial [Actinobacteria bacterium]|nr:hypothetical protein [Actinomycetota bacterium]